MKVRIYKPHTHAGKRYTPGPEGLDIEMEPHSAEWLKKHTDVCKPPAPAVEQKPATPGQA